MKIFRLLLVAMLGSGVVATAAVPVLAVLWWLKSSVEERLAALLGADDVVLETDSGALLKRLAEAIRVDVDRLRGARHAGPSGPSWLTFAPPLPVRTRSRPARHPPRRVCRAGAEHHHPHHDPDRHRRSHS